MDIKEITSSLDEVASSIENQDPRIAFALDVVSDRLEREAGLKEIGEKVKEKVKELGSKAKNLIFKKFMPSVIKKLTNRFKKVVDKLKSVIFKRSGVALKLVNSLISKAQIDPKVKAELQQATSGNDAIVAMKKLKQLQKSYPVEGKDQEEALAIAKKYQGNIKKASLDISIEAGFLDFLKKPSVLITASLAILLMSVGSPEAAANILSYIDPAVDPASLAYESGGGLVDLSMSTFTKLVDKVTQSNGIVDHFNQIITGTFSRVTQTIDSKPLYDFLDIYVREGVDYNEIRVLLPPGTTQGDVVKILQNQLNDRPELIEEIMTHLKM